MNKFLNEQKRYTIHHTKWKKHHNQSLYYYVTLLYMILWSIRMIVSSIVEKQHETSTHILRPQTPPANMSQFHHPLQLKYIPFIWNCFLPYIVVEWMKKSIKSALPLSVNAGKEPIQMPKMEVLSQGRSTKIKSTTWLLWSQWTHNWWISWLWRLVMFGWANPSKSRIWFFAAVSSDWKFNVI